MDKLLITLTFVLLLKTDYTPTNRHGCIIVNKKKSLNVSLLTEAAQTKIVSVIWLSWFDRNNNIII